MRAQPRQQASHAQPAALLRTIFQALDASGRPYALIRSDRNLDEALESDVDIAFGENPNEVMLTIIRRVAETSDAHLIQCLHYEIPHGYYYVLATRRRCRLLHRDSVHHPTGASRYRLLTLHLLEGVVAVPCAGRAA